MIRSLLSLALCAALCSCASVSVKRVEYLTAKPPRAVPKEIFVKPFAFYEPNVDVDRSGRKLSEFEYEFQEKITRHLVKRLPERIAPARAIAATAPEPRGNYWLITGRVDRVSQGSRLLRTIGGTPLGATALETSVTVTDLSGPMPRSFLLIQTTGGSNTAMPVLGARDGLTFDVIRTTREIVAALSEYYYHQGIIPYESAIGPKRNRNSITSPYQRRATGPMMSY